MYLHQQSNPDYYSPHSGDIEPERINASRWLVMTFTSNNGAIYKNEVNHLTVSLKNYFDNETKEIYEYDGEFNLPLDVTFYTNARTLTTKKLVNGIATFDYTPQSKDNASYAKINNQILKIDDFQLMKTNIIVNNLERYYGSTSQLAVKLVKENNIPIAKEQLNVILGGKSYTIKTDENGIAKLTLKNSPNKYTVKITFNGNKYVGSSKSVQVKIVKPIIKASKLKIHKKGYYIVTFKDANKKAIKNVKVKFTIKGKTYIRITDSKGQTKLKITLKPGKYSVKVGFKHTAYYGTSTLTKQIIVIK